MRLRLDVLEVEGVRDGAGRAAIERSRPTCSWSSRTASILPADVLAIADARQREPALLAAAPVARRSARAAGDPRGRRRDRRHVMLLDEGLDTGPVLARSEPSRSAPTTMQERLGARLAELGGRW